VLELRASRQIHPAEIADVRIEIFAVAYHIIGGGEEGDKQDVGSKEEADHSLPYMVAVALLDGVVSPAQYAPERIVREDVQSLLRNVTIRPDEELSRLFPAQLPCRIQITLKNGQTLVAEKRDYEGFYTRPLSWEQAVAKFEGLAASSLDGGRRDALIETVAHLETVDVQQLTALLAAPHGARV
jgi:2-methylcitrate dehydratase